MKLTARDRQRLQGVHLDLVLVVDRAAALTPVPFIITEGMRTKARQAELVKAGASRTMNGRHLTGHAVDIAAVVGTEIRWDFGLYLRIAYAVKRAAINEGVLSSGVNLALDRQSDVDSGRVRRILTIEGWRTAVRRVDGRNARVWVPGTRAERPAVPQIEDEAPDVDAWAEYGSAAGGR